VGGCEVTVDPYHRQPRRRAADRVGGCEVTVDPYHRQPRRRAADRVDRAAASRLFARP
jgi:hypothetical protein